MAASLHQRTSISQMMELLDNLATVKKCFQQIETSVLSSGIHKRLKSIIATCQHAVKNIEKMAAKLTDKRTLLAHKQMILKGGRPISKPKSAARCSERHVNKIRKRKWSEVDVASIKTDLTDLYQAGRLARPVDVAQIILDADKRIRSTMYKIMANDLLIAKEKCLRDNVTRYIKYLQGKGLAPKERFAAGGRRPIMSINKFKTKINEALKNDPHQQKDLRKLTHDVLTKEKRDKLQAKKKKPKGDQQEVTPPEEVVEGDSNKLSPPEQVVEGDSNKLSPLMKCEPCESVVDKYLRVASTCHDVKHIGKVCHSTRARDTAIRSFRGVCTYIAVVLASQSYPDPVSHKPPDSTPFARCKGRKDHKDRDIESLFPYPVKWINTALILNTDECTLVLVKNKGGKKKWVVVSRQFREAKKANFTQYSTEPDPNQVHV